MGLRGLNWGDVRTSVTFPGRGVSVTQGVGVRSWVGPRRGYRGGPELRICLDLSSESS